jgi:hypothetical protein
MVGTGQGGGIDPRKLKQGEAATASVKKLTEKAAKLADELGKLSPPSDAKAKKEYDALLKQFSKHADQIDKASTLLMKKEATARKGLPKDQQKAVAAKIGKDVGAIDKLGTGLKKTAMKCQANAKKGGSGKGDDKTTLKKMHTANQAMGALGKQIAASQTKILVAQ